MSGEHPSLNVLITGCSAGFGELIAKSVAGEGHRVLATMRDTEGRNREIAAELRDWARRERVVLQVLELDVASDASVNTAFEALHKSDALPSVVVNNAGIAAMGPMESFDIEQMRYLYEVNVFGPMRVNQAALPEMRKRRAGLIIQVSSTLGRVLPLRGGLYPASKWAVEGMAESLAYEVRPFGIDVVILEPGAFPTTATSRGLRPARAEVAAEYSRQNQSSSAAFRADPPADYVAPDPQLVAEEVCRLIAMAPGTRPLRRVVGPIFTEGVAEYNSEYERVRDHLREVLRRPDQAVPWAGRRP